MLRLLALLFFPTIARLATHRRRKLLEAGWESTYDEASQTIVATGGPKFYLGNVLEDLRRASWWSRFVLLRRQDQALAEMLVLPPSLEDALPRLLPRVNDRIFFESLRSSTQEIQIPSEPINDDLCVCLVVDSPNTTAYVSTAMLETWERSLGDLLPVARANLLARTDADAFETVAPGVLRSMHRDDFDDARALLAPLLHDLPLRGRKLVCLANRNGLFVAGEDEPDALDHLLAVTSEAMAEESRAMNGRVHRLEGFELVDFVAPESNALHERRVGAYVRDLLGDALDPTDDFPRRYVATQFPDAATLERLRALASIRE